jgi:hypothetical protein
MKIRVKLVFEKDLCKMQGFWDHVDIQHQHQFKMNRDDYVKTLLHEAEHLMQIPRAHFALFTLHYRNNPRQVRFNFISTTSTFRQHIPQYNAPHFDTSDPYLLVLCVASRGYDLQTWKWTAPKEMRPDELARWNDDQVVMLVVKYFCPQNRRIVTLGCHYMNVSEKLVNMVDTGWVQDRLESYVVNKDVAALSADVTWECWEEFSERDVQPRNTQRTVKIEQLWSGDVIIWQPVVAGEPDASHEARSGEGEDVTPLYPVLTVSDHALHLVNSVDICVTLHDSKQPLCVDGMVSSGQWGPPRPPSAVAIKDPKKPDVSPSKEESPEQMAMEAALSQSPAQFKMPEEKEIKMDLRWSLGVVTNTIAKAFGLRPQTGESQLWLFHAAPSSSYQEPLNTHAMRNEQMLKDLQRNAIYMSSSNKRASALHAVELPFQPGRQVFEKNLCPLCVRFYDDAVREVGSAIITVPNSGTAADVLAEAKKHLQEDWGIRGALRLLEIADCRLHRNYRPETPVSQFLCFNKPNIFFHSLRVEADDMAGQSDPNVKHIEIFHCDRQSQLAFAQPLLLPVLADEKAGSIKNRCKEKLQVPEGEFKSWRLVRCRARKTHLKDDEAWDSDPVPENNLCLEHVHPNPTSSLVRQSRYNKPLTIK